MLRVLFGPTLVGPSHHNDAVRKGQLFFFSLGVDLEESVVLDVEEAGFGESEVFSFFFHVELHEEYLLAVANICHQGFCGVGIA